MKAARSARAGFTLAEVAVTLVIVGMMLVLILQGINTAKMTAAHTHHAKVARQLALLTLGRVEAGLFWEDMDRTLFGTYAEEGYPEWEWELAVGEESLSDLPDEDSTLQFDSLRHREELERERMRDENQDPEEVEQPFEKVRIRVTFPKLLDQPSELVIERWIPWKQVYGLSEEEQEAEER